MSTPKQALEMAKKAGAKMVDVKFVDTFGTWQHFTLPFSELNEDSFSEGLGFDGSSIRGWKSIEASDMLAMPDAAPAASHNGPKNTSNPPASPTASCSVRKRSSSSSTASSSTPRATAHSTRL